MFDTNSITDKKRNLIFMNIIITCIATSMLSTALTTALPPVIEDLQISVAQGQWLTSGYSLAMGIMMPLTAFLINRFPTKKLYLSGIILFIAGSVVCVSTKSFYVMMLGRILQACGNGLLTSMAQVVLLTIYPAEKIGTIMGWYGLSVGATPVIAPTLAGVLVDSLGWKTIFYIPAGIMVISFIVAVFVFGNVLETSKKKFDTISFVLSAFAFGGVTLGIGNIGQYGLMSVNVIAVLIVGILASIVFVYRQFNLDQPFLNLRVFKTKEFTLSVVGSMVLYLVMMGSSIIMPLYVQSIMGYSATISGLVTLPGSLAMAIISPNAGKLFDKNGMKKLFIGGAFLMLVSNVGMSFINMNTPILVAAVLNVIRCIAIGSLLMNLVTWGVKHVDSSLTADASAVLNSLRTIAGAIGASVFVGLMTIFTNNSLATYGVDAGIHGLNMTFICMSVVSVFLLLIPILFIKKEER